jgi:hypothetical protein
MEAKQLTMEAENCLTKSSKNQQLNGKKRFQMSQQNGGADSGNKQTGECRISE